MDFLELSNFVLNEAESFNAPQDPIEGIPLSPSAPESHRRAVQWVKQEYHLLQLRQRFWTFHHNEGLFLTTDGSGGTGDYAKANVRTALDDAWRARHQGETYEWPLTYLTYQQWRNGFSHTYATLSNGTPQWITRLPSGEFRLTPKDDTTVYEIFGDWYRTAHALEAADDEPLWDEEFHLIVAWLALRNYQEEYDVSPLVQRIHNNLLPLMTDFRNRYLPRLER